ncbi:MAG: adenylate cyclase [Eubacteriales bacterium]|jgi:Cdc6-like AAA superfamily ATPase|nr:adenylate cyclase [Eubacteriales bacterium]MDD4344186.1 adenylate cyclase [Eubacteriales bacterium]NCC80860.1 adenylate cyclase [Clostridia bacterium]
MNYPIKNLEDVYKFSLPLYDYLNKTGHKEMAKIFEELVDDCFDNESRSLAAHKKAYKKVLEEVDGLPTEMVTALEEALDLMR